MLISIKTPELPRVSPARSPIVQCWVLMLVINGLAAHFTSRSDSGTNIGTGTEPFSVFLSHESSLALYGFFGSVRFVVLIHQWTKRESLP